MQVNCNTGQVHIKGDTLDAQRRQNGSIFGSLKVFCQRSKLPINVVDFVSCNKQLSVHPTSSSGDALEFIIQVANRLREASGVKLDFNAASTCGSSFDGVMQCRKCCLNSTNKDSSF